MRIAVLLIGSALLIAPCVPGQSPVFTTLYSFQGGADGALFGGGTNAPMPNGVIFGKHGTLYGTTYVGGTNACQGVSTQYLCGTVYELTPATGTPWTKTIIHSFNGGDGALPDASLVFDANGNLMGQPWWAAKRTMGARYSS